jgi:hypothetical protein
MTVKAIMPVRKVNLVAANYTERHALKEAA